MYIVDQKRWEYRRIFFIFQFSLRVMEIESVRAFDIHSCNVSAKRREKNSLVKRFDGKDEIAVEYARRRVR